MNRRECDQLDDYLLGWLSPEGAAAFERHLAGCPSCRREHELQRSIDRALAGPDVSLDPIPASLVERIRGQVRARGRRRAIRRNWLAAAAATLLIAVAAGGWTVNRLRQNGGEHAAAPGPTQESPESVAGSPGDPSAGSVPPDKPALVNPDPDGPPSGDPALIPTRQVAASARVVLADPSAGIVVPVETKDPKITMVWIYPTFKPAAQSGAAGGK